MTRPPAKTTTKPKAKTPAKPRAAGRASTAPKSSAGGDRARAPSLPLSEAERLLAAMDEALARTQRARDRLADNVAALRKKALN